MKIIGIEDGHLRSCLIALAKKKLTPKEAVYEIIGRHFPAALDLREALDSFVRVCVALRASTDVEADWQLVTELLGYGVAYRYDLGPDSLPAVEAMRKKVVAADSTWLSSKLRAIECGIDALEMFREKFADRQEKRLSLMYRFSTVVTANPAAVELTRQIFQGIGEFRRYGIKPSLYKTPMTDAGWIYNDSQDIAVKPGASFVAPDVLARAVMMKDLQGTRERVVEFVVRSDGEFDCSLGYGIIPVREVMAGYGFENTYDGLRLIAAVRLFDLTVSCRTVERANRELPLPLRLLKKYNLDGPTPALVLPRLRALERESSRVAREIEEEVESDLHATSLRRNHRVEAHVRQLPPGCKPSPAALELARSHNFVLLPGETYVRKHRRGKGAALPDLREVSTRY